MPDGETIEHDEPSLEDRILHINDLACRLIAAATAAMQAPGMSPQQNQELIKKLRKIMDEFARLGGQTSAVCRASEAYPQSPADIALIQQFKDKLTACEDTMTRFSYECSLILTRAEIGAATQSLH